MFDIITVPFGWLMMQLYQLTQNYGVALIIFGILVKVVLLPVTAKSKKSTMKMSRMQPRIKAIQQKYANDQQKQAQAMQALYKEEGVSMLGGCLWGLVPLLILIPLYSVVREPLVYMLGFSEEHATGILNALAPLDPNTFSATNYYAQMAAAQQLPNYLQNPEFLDAIKTAGIEISEFAAQGVNFSFLGIDLGAEPAIITGFTFTWAFLGLALMPLLSAGSQMVSVLISNKLNNSVVTNDRGVYDKETAESSQTNKTSKTMMWIMPLMSLWIGFNMPAAMSLYWLIQGVVGTVMDIGLTKHYRKIYDAEDAIKLQHAMEKEREEAEKERIRAERRAQNPDGITENTSKKKLQQAKKAEEEAAKAAAAKEYAIKKGLEQEDTEKKPNVPGDRPNSRGRAYDPNRYNSSSTEE